MNVAFSHSSSPSCDAKARAVKPPRVSGTSDFIVKVRGPQFQIAEYELMKCNPKEVKGLRSP